MKENIADINSRGMAWTIEQLNQWTKENLGGTRVSTRVSVVCSVAILC